MQVQGQLVKAQIENLTSDPTGTGLVPGRIWYRTDLKLARVYDGVTVLEFADITSAQTFTNKILSNPEYLGSDLRQEIVATPATPAAGKKRLYFKTDGKLYKLDSGGVETEIGSGLADGSVTTAKLADGAVTQAKIAVRPTGTTVAAGGVAVSASCNNFAVSPTVFTDVTNLSVTITTTGKPVVIKLIPDGTTNISQIKSYNAGATAGAFFAFFRDASQISNQLISNTSSGDSNQQVVTVSSALSTVDFPAAGTYTYKLQVNRQVTNDLVSVFYSKLMVYEL